MIGYADLIGYELENGRDPRQSLTALAAAGNDAADFARRLKLFSDSQDAMLELVNLSEFMLDAYPQIRQAIPARIQLVWEAAEGELPIYADTDQLFRVLLCLVTNAFEATEGEGQVTVRTERSDRVLEHESVHGAVVLSVSDSGKGIPIELQGRVFDLGFSTKNQEPGTGLSLGTAREMIQGHSGEIEFESTPGDGSTFRILLPLHPIR